jgi:NhaP-type Na+/H+ or K+/H+ antiporter
MALMAARFFMRFYEALGGIALGVAIGLPAAFLTGRLRPGEPSLIEAIGVVMLCTGLSLYFEVSFPVDGNGVRCRDCELCPSP